MLDHTLCNWARQLQLEQFILYSVSHHTISPNAFLLKSFYEYVLNKLAISIGNIHLKIICCSPQYKSTDGDSIGN